MNNKTRNGGDIEYETGDLGDHRGKKNWARVTTAQKIGGERSWRVIYEGLCCICQAHLAQKVLQLII